MNRISAIITLAVASYLIVNCHPNRASSRQEVAVVSEECLRVCADNSCLDSLSFPGGGTINMEGEYAPLSPTPWLLIPDYALDTFRLDFYNVTGRKIATIIQDCKVASPVRVYPRLARSQMASGVYFIMLSRNGVGLGTQKFLWLK